jgi:hypothetical protein
MRTKSETDVIFFTTKAAMHQSCHFINIFLNLRGIDTYNFTVRFHRAFTQYLRMKIHQNEESGLSVFSGNRSK